MWKICLSHFLELRLGKRLLRAWPALSKADALQPCGRPQPAPGLREVGGGVVAASCHFEK